MSFWTPDHAQSESRLVLVRWRAWEVQVPVYNAPSWHLVGYLPDEKSAKVSSALAYVHLDAAEVSTKTGKTYVIEAAPGIDANATHLWENWRREHSAVVLREVTTDVLAHLQPGPVGLRRRTI